MFALFSLFMVLWALEADRRTQLTHAESVKIFKERVVKIQNVINTVKKFIIWLFNKLIVYPLYGAPKKAERVQGVYEYPPE